MAGRAVAVKSRLRGPRRKNSGRSGWARLARGKIRLFLPRKSIIDFPGPAHNQTDEVQMRREMRILMTEIQVVSEIVIQRISSISAIPSENHFNCSENILCGIQKIFFYPPVRDDLCIRIDFSFLFMENFNHVLKRGKWSSVFPSKAGKNSGTDRRNASGAHGDLTVRLVARDRTWRRRRAFGNDPHDVARDDRPRTGGLIFQARGIFFISTAISPGDDLHNLPDTEIFSGRRIIARVSRRDAEKVESMRIAGTIPDFLIIPAIRTLNNSESSNQADCLSQTLSNHRLPSSLPVEIISPLHLLSLHPQNGPLHFPFPGRNNPKYFGRASQA